MAKINGKLAYGVKIMIEVPLVPSKDRLDSLVKMAEGTVNAALQNAVKTSLAILPFAKITITASKAQIVVESVET